ncbi:hypothetical protein ACS0TY_013190 [Phlomoides rotata]
MMESAMKNDNFSPVLMGAKNIKVSILQYTDNTIFFGEAKKSNIFTIKCILRVFKLWSGLRVNFNKSHISVINVEESVIDE